MSLNFGNQFIVNDTDWTTFKTQVGARKIRMQFDEESDKYTIFAVDEVLVFKTVIYKGTVPSSGGLSQTVNDASRQDFETNFKASSNKPLLNRNDSGMTMIQPMMREGSKVQIMTQNFCDKTTWYGKSIRRTGVSLSPADGYANVFVLQTPTVMVDVTHGKIFAETRIRSTYKPVVYVDGIAAMEKDPDTGIGDYEIDYRTGKVTFNANPEGVVTIDYSEVTTSEWYIKPNDGKRLRLIIAELQFSTDCQMKDSWVFQPRAEVGKCPLFNPYWDQNPDGPPGPYPAGTMLPLGDPVIYQTVMDLIVESLGSQVIIPKSQLENPGWRDLKVDVQLFRWSYETQATIDVKSSWGMDIEIKLMNHRENDGTFAVVAFYALSEDE